MKRAMGVEGEATLTESEKKGVVARTKILRGVQEGARQVRGAVARQEFATAEPERAKEIETKAGVMGRKKAVLGELKREVPAPEEKEALDKKEAQIKKAVDKRMLSEAFKRLRAEKQARDLLRRVGSYVSKMRAVETIKAGFSRAVADMRAKAKAESDELEAEIVKQQRETLASILMSKGLGKEEADAEADDVLSPRASAGGGGGADASTLGGTEAGTVGTDPKSARISVAKAELERLSAEVEPIKVGGKDLVVDISGGGRKQLKLGGKTITSNRANLPILEQIQTELGKTRRVDPVANAIRTIVDQRIAQAKSTHGGGALGGQGKRSGTPAKAGGGASGGGRA